MNNFVEPWATIQCYPKSISKSFKKYIFTIFCFFSLSLQLLLFLSPVLYSALIVWLIIKGEQIWFVFMNSTSTLRNTVNSKCKTKRSSKDCKRFFFIVSKIDIIWSSQTTPEFINYQLSTSSKTFLSFKYLCHLFLASGWLHFWQEYY